MVLLIVVVVVLALIAAGWLIDRHDRRQGRKVQNGREIAERVRVARRQRRNTRVRYLPGMPRQTDEPRPVKRGH